MRDFTKEEIIQGERIASLFAKYYRRTISRMEIEELHEWVGGNPEKREPIFRELTNRKLIRKALKILNS